MHAEKLLASPVPGPVRRYGGSAHHAALFHGERQACTTAATVTHSSDWIFNLLFMVAERKSAISILGKALKCVSNGTKSCLALLLDEVFGR